MSHLLALARKELERLKATMSHQEVYVQSKYAQYIEAKNRLTEDEATHIQLSEELRKLEEKSIDNTD